MANDTPAVLIVDDDVAFAASTRLLLEHEGYVVHVAGNGAEGLKKAAEIHPSLILLDVVMGHTTEGFEVARAIRATPALEKTPVVLVTGIRRELSLPFTFEADNEFLPVTRVVEKPVSPELLLNTVNELTRGTGPTTTPLKEDAMERKALIVDDNPEFAASVAELLKGEGYEVATAEDGAKGFEAARTSKPDLVLMDVMMEDCGAGLDTVRKLREDEATKEIPVIIVTGIRKPELLLTSYAPGEAFPNVKNVFEKPVEPATLMAALAKVA